LGGAAAFSGEIGKEGRGEGGNGEGRGSATPGRNSLGRDCLSRKKKLSIRRSRKKGGNLSKKIYWGAPKKGP